MLTGLPKVTTLCEIDVSCRRRSPHPWRAVPHTTVTPGYPRRAATSEACWRDEAPRIHPLRGGRIYFSSVRLKCSAANRPFVSASSGGVDQRVVRLSVIGGRVRGCHSDQTADAFMPAQAV